MKSIAVGDTRFASVIGSGSYYVDKTGSIKTVMEFGALVHIFTRPRGFGKTLFLDTLRTFLEVNPKNPEDTSLQAELFDGLEITREKEFCLRWMGKTPVLALSFDGVDGDDFSTAYAQLMRRLVAVAHKHEYLLTSTKLSEQDKSMFANYCSLDFMLDPANQMSAMRFMSDMLIYLAKHFDRRVVLLIDDYDAPLVKAARRPWYQEMKDFLQIFLSDAKPEFGPCIHGLPVMLQAVMTGGLYIPNEIGRPGTESVGNSVCSLDRFHATTFGFTEEETEAMLAEFGLASSINDVRHFFDGYRIADQKVYCPWDIVHFCSSALSSHADQQKRLGDFRVSAGGNDIIDRLLAQPSREVDAKLQTLLNGGTMELHVQEIVNHSRLVGNWSDDLWSLLFLTGYLTVHERLGHGHFMVRIPNQEIRQAFADSVRRHRLV